MESSRNGQIYVNVLIDAFKLYDLFTFINTKEGVYQFNSSVTEESVDISLNVENDLAENIRVGDQNGYGYNKPNRTKSYSFKIEGSDIDYSNSDVRNMVIRDADAILKVTNFCYNVKENEFSTLDGLIKIKVNKTNTNISVLNVFKILSFSILASCGFITVHKLRQLVSRYINIIIQNRNVEANIVTNIDRRKGIFIRINFVNIPFIGFSFNLFRNFKPPWKNRKLISQKMS